MSINSYRNQFLLTYYQESPSSLKRDAIQILTEKNVPTISYVVYISNLMIGVELFASKNNFLIINYICNRSCKLSPGTTVHHLNQILSPLYKLYRNYTNVFLTLLQSFQPPSPLKYIIKQHTQVYLYHYELSYILKR